MGTVSEEITCLYCGKPIMRELVDGEVYSDQGAGGPWEHDVCLECAAARRFQNSTRLDT